MLNPFDSEQFDLKRILIMLVFLVGFIVLIIYLFKTNPQIFQQIVETYGLPGLFIVAIIANATIVLPVPIDIFVFFLSDFTFFPIRILSPLLLAATVAFGAAIGELSGYLLGAFSINSFEKMKSRKIAQIEEMELRIHKYGMIVIMLGALIPFPFDIIGMAAGLLKFDAKKFFIACFTGKFMRYLIITYAGYYSLSFIKPFLSI